MSKDKAVYTETFLGIKIKIVSEIIQLNVLKFGLTKWIGC